MVILFLNFVCAAKSFDINDPSTYLDNPGDVYEAMKDPGQLKKINDNIAGMSTLNRITVRRTIFEQANPGMIPPNTPGLASKEFIFLDSSPPKERGGAHPPLTSCTKLLFSVPPYPVFCLHKNQIEHSKLRS